MNLYVRPRVNRSHNFFLSIPIDWYQKSIFIDDCYRWLSIITDFRFIDLLRLNLSQISTYPYIFRNRGSLDRTVFENCVFNMFYPEREVVKRRFIQSVTSAIVWLKCCNCKYISHLPQIGLNLFPLPSPPLSLSFKNNFPLNNRCYVCIFETITSE